MQKLKDLIYYNRKEIFIVFVFLLLFSLYIFFNTDNEYQEDIIEIEKTVVDEFVVIDIKGEVSKPGTYKLKKEDRIIDAIEISGGLTNDADTSKINLSEKLTDEMLIIIPKKSEFVEENNETTKEVVEEVSDNKISINTASVDELMTIKGIGFTKASNIVEYRNKNGKFKSIDDLLKVSGIGKATLEKIKDYIKV